jgi:pimeloyl-ACP methyl ester carboxylesterase
VSRPTVEVAGATIEFVDLAGAEPPLVFLHEGLGSIDLWRTFPDEIHAATGRRTVVYSRPGYGHSTPVPPPWPVTYMHDHALVTLPALLARLAIERPVLVGHSDGASIALIHAGAGHQVSALVVLAPHVFVEDESVAGIEAARDAYESTLRPRLARYHDDVDATFWGWNGVWLSPEFRSWNIERDLPAIEVPVLAMQGTEDQYGTLAQLDAIASGTAGATDRVVLDGRGHVLHTGASGPVVDAVAGFVERVSRPAG